MATTSQSLTEVIPAAARPADVRSPGFDPFKAWDSVTHQLAVVAPVKTERIKSIREAMLPSIRV